LEKKRLQFLDQAESLKISRNPRLPENLLLWKWRFKIVLSITADQCSNFSKFCLYSYEIQIYRNCYSVLSSSVVIFPELLPSTHRIHGWKCFQILFFILFLQATSCLLSELWAWREIRYGGESWRGGGRSRCQEDRRSSRIRHRSVSRSILQIVRKRWRYRFITQQQKIHKNGNSEFKKYFQHLNRIWTWKYLI